MSFACERLVMSREHTGNARDLTRAGNFGRKSAEINTKGALNVVLIDLRQQMPWLLGRNQPRGHLTHAKGTNRRTPNMDKRRLAGVLSLWWEDSPYRVLRKSRRDFSCCCVRPNS